jgi:Gpi18-like mannosyltransferase
MVNKTHPLNKEKKSRMAAAAILSLFVLALLIRYLLMPFTNYDTDGYSRWYDFIVKHGIRYSLGQNFSIYTPPYLYLLALATLFQQIIPKLVAIKLIPITFDFFSAGIVFKLLRLKHPKGNFPAQSATLFLLMPTIVVNSAFWGQIDSVYTCFLLLCVYLLLKDRSGFAMIAFGAAISFKAQAAFLAPFLLVLCIRKRIAWYEFGLIPLTYFLAMLPAILAGRSVLDVFTVYLDQASELQILSFNAPNWYVFMPQSIYPIAMPTGMVLTSLAIISWIVVNHRRNFPLTHDTITFLALFSTAITPFLLPKMHDRYFYPADVFSLMVAFGNPRFWFVPVIYQIVSGLAYSIFLFDAPRSIVLVLATELNTMLVAFLVWEQFNLLKNPRKDDSHQGGI